MKYDIKPAVTHGNVDFSFIPNKWRKYHTTMKGLLILLQDTAIRQNNNLITRYSSLKWAVPYYKILLLILYLNAIFKLLGKGTAYLNATYTKLSNDAFC